jgi:hypothetical protein
MIGAQTYAAQLAPLERALAARKRAQAAEAIEVRKLSCAHTLKSETL